MVVGVNGAGKTTTIGKLAAQLTKAGQKVWIGAADTFRAAAIDQLKVWADRAGATMIRQEMGSDPASVAFDTLTSAKANGADVVLIDTAGRLHNKVNLMNELTKIRNVMGKVIPGAPHEVMLVLDGSTGQNAFEQARQFTQATQVTSLTITKLDGTAKGGVVIGISDQFHIPVRYIGIGEGIDQLRIFDRKEFVKALFGDGSGDNLKGITRYSGVKSVESIISTSVFTVAAGGVESVEEVDNGLIVELKAPNDLLIEGLKVTGAAAVTNTSLNATYDVIKVNDRRIFLEGATLASGNTKDLLATDISKLTLTFKNGAANSIESPNSIDALETAISVMTYAQFAPTVLVLNPITINAIRCEKATDGNRLDVVKDINGNPVIGGLRVVPFTGIPVGKYFLGDMQRGAQIIDYTPLTVEWADDVNTKLKNQIVLMAQAEEIVPVFCPWAFAYGSISALKTAIKKSNS